MSMLNRREKAAAVSALYFIGAKMTQMMEEPGLEEPGPEEKIALAVVGEVMMTTADDLGIKPDDFDVVDDNISVKIDSTTESFTLEDLDPYIEEWITQLAVLYRQRKEIRAATTSAEPLSINMN